MSTKEEAPTCPACGARLSADAEACDLCGTPVAATDLPQVDVPDADDPPADTDGAPDERPVFCNACGWENPPNARYCSQCGEALQQTEAPAPRPVAADLPSGSDAAASGEDEPDTPEEVPDTSDMTRQIGLVVGAAVLVVVGLFVASTWSEQIDWGGASPTEPAAPMASGNAPAGGGPAAGGPSSGAATEGGATDLVSLVQQNATDSVPDALRDQIATLQDEIEARSGAEQRAKQRELANLYVGAGQLGQAAVIQRRIAEASGEAEAWRRTGDLLYSWMETLDGEQPVSATVAEHVVQAYQNVLDQDPDNLDVRTDMATAYLQTNQPMRGVEEINRVLEADPDHFQARFNKGIMLTMIGRVDDAIQQFERVKTIVGEESPYYQQAEQAIQTIRSRMEEEGGD